MLGILVEADWNSIYFKIKHNNNIQIAQLFKTTITRVDIDNKL